MAEQSSIAFDRFKTDDIAAANALLASRESALNPPGSSPEPSRNAESEPVERQTTPETAEPPANANSLPADTPAAPDTRQAAPQQRNTETTPANGDNGKGSAFKKDQERRDLSWKALNNEKAQVAAERQAIQTERVKLQQEQQQFQQRREGAAKTKLTPELYDQSAQQADKIVTDSALQLKGLKAMKAEYEQNGQYTEAAKIDQKIEEMQDAVSVAKYQAKQFRELAANMRANPDLTGDALQKRNQQHLQHYTLEAAKKWPQLAEANSEFQKATARAINVLRQSGLDENEFPVLRYFAAEHVSAQSAAARVPAMDKELVQLRARIKELETNSTPGGGTTAQPNLRPGTKPQTLEAEGESLKREAELRGAKG